MMTIRDALIHLSFLVTLSLVMLAIIIFDACSFMYVMAHLPIRPWKEFLASTMIWNIPLHSDGPPILISYVSLLLYVVVFAGQFHLLSSLPAYRTRTWNFQEPSTIIDAILIGLFCIPNFLTSMTVLLSFFTNAISPTDIIGYAITWFLTLGCAVVGTFGGEWLATHLYREFVYAGYPQIIRHQTIHQARSHPPTS
jgi:hypothetical protein